MRQPLGQGDPYFIPTASDKRIKIGVNAGGEDIYVLVNAMANDNCPIKGVKFRWLNTMSQKTFAQYTRTYGKRPGYSIVGAGLQLPELRKLTADLGLPDAYVDVARGRIAYAEYVLAMIPIDECVLRLKELTDHEREKRGSMLESHLARLEGPGLTPVHRQVGDHLDRKEFHTREDRPFVSMVPAPTGG